MSIADFNSWVPAVELINKILVSLSLLFCLSVVQAETVYRSIDETGAVEFSDQSHHDAEEIKLKNVPTYDFKKAERKTTAPAMKDKKTAVQMQLRIVSPADKETVRQNAGDVSVVISMTGGTDKASTLQAKEKIAIFLDGKMLLQMDKTSVVLNNIDRGTHHLKAQLLNAEGKAVAESPVVEFYMKRFSKLFKKPVNPVQQKPKTVPPVTQ